MRPLVVATLLSVFTAAHADEVVPGRLLVRFRAPRPLDVLALDGWTARGRRRLDAQTHLLEIPGADEEATRRLAVRLGSDPAVAWAEPDRVRRPARTPDDPLLGLQWGLSQIHAQAAWDRSTGKRDLVVAVVDTGMRAHPELADRVVPGWDFISDAANAGDGNGRDPDPTDEGDADESSSGRHGVHIAGIIGAAANNGVGISGVDWACRIQPVRALGVEHGAGIDSDIADAIRWAAGLHVDGVPDNATPADVINLSFGGQGRSHTMQAAIDDAVAHGATVVAAAGNLGRDASDDSPAGLDGVNPVGAVDETGQTAHYSNWGPRLLVMAPGGLPEASGGVLSTEELPQAGFTYAYYAGTSQATAFVSAAVALMKSVDPALTPAQARLALAASADPRARCASPGKPSESGCGAGLLDLEQALAIADEQSACGAACDPGELCQGGQCAPVTGFGQPAPRADGGGCEIARGRPGAVPLAVLALGVVLLLGRRRSTV
jgi:serine protease